MNLEPDTSFDRLLEFMERLPAIQLPAGRKSIGVGRFENQNWWVKFHFDVEHPLAWRHVQEFGFVLNYVSIKERLPTVFKPVSPPPYLNGGVEFLSWIIESTDPTFTPDLCVWNGWKEDYLDQSMSLHSGIRMQPVKTKIPSTISDPKPQNKNKQ